MFKYTFPLTLVVVLALTSDYLVAGHNPKQQHLSKQSAKQSNQSQNQSPKQSSNQSSSGRIITNDKDCALRFLMNRVWIDHVIWKRQGILSAIDGLAEEVRVVKQRLKQNYDDIVNTLVPFYGLQAVAEFAALLEEHNKLGGALAVAILAKDMEQARKLQEQAYANASNMATALSELNPYWNQQEMTNMFNDHLKLTYLQLQFRIEQDWASDAANLDQNLTQGLMMAKALADGVLKQFPNHQTLNQNQNLHQNQNSNQSYGLNQGQNFNHGQTSNQNYSLNQGYQYNPRG